MNKRPEIKVVAAAGGGTVVSGLILWLVGVFVFHVAGDAAHAEVAVKAVPSYLSAAIIAAVTFLLGYFAPRTSDAERAAASSTDTSTPPSSTPPSTSVVDDNGAPVQITRTT